LAFTVSGASVQAESDSRNDLLLTINKTPLLSSYRFTSLMPTPTKTYYRAAATTGQAKYYMHDDEDEAGGDGWPVTLVMTNLDEVEIAGPWIPSIPEGNAVFSASPPLMDVVFLDQSLWGGWPVKGVFLVSKAQFYVAQYLPTYSVVKDPVTNNWQVQLTQ
jgi:hypothetical protein